MYVHLYQYFRHNTTDIQSCSMIDYEMEYPEIMTSLLIPYAVCTLPEDHMVVQ